MRIGIISEGRSDLAVVKSVLIGVTGLDESDFDHIRPEYSKDSTDLAWENPPDSFSTWSAVQKECVSREKIDPYFMLVGNDFIAIHIDSAEAEMYGVVKPPMNEKYCEDLRTLVVSKIDEWLENNYIDKILHAVAIEETDAWILTIYSQGKDSAILPNPKRQLNQRLSRKDINSTIDYDNYFSLSNDFRSKTKVLKDGFLNDNLSLKQFWEEAERKICKKQTAQILLTGVNDKAQLSEYLELVLSKDVVIHESPDNSVLLEITSSIDFNNQEALDELIDKIQKGANAYSETNMLQEIIIK